MTREAYRALRKTIGSQTAVAETLGLHRITIVNREGGKQPIDTGSTKVGSLIGDHTKTSIGTLFNTGAYVGAMGLIMGTGEPLPKFIPSFAWFIGGKITKGFGRRKLYESAKTAMGRRDAEWTEPEQAMWDAVFEMTADVRIRAIKKGRRAMKRS